MMRNYPNSVIILLITVFSYTLWNGLKLLALVKYWNVLIDFNAIPGSLYLTLMAIGWIVTGIWLLIILVQKNPRGITYLKVVIWLYATWYWVDRLIFRNTFRSFLVPLILSSITLIILTILMNHKKTKDHFAERKQ